ncbi:hypothetical protein PR048_002837 [Dryococelus australis]|uniref:HTH psq-type domain-containing protein n=1 Tax=Dryococelus australis TaxID=614101 RepID=A0ABQ9IMT4_9NEOP|nr:hypothetical protein PR048_002837 [Dryococelus australis]
MDRGPKANSATREKWSIESMQRAVHAVRTGSISENRATVVYDVPRQTLRRAQLQELAFNLAEKLGLQHRFNKEAGLADWGRLWSYLKRHTDLSIRKEENLSINRALSMNKSEVGLFFDLLEDKMSELNLTNKADRIFNIDERGFQLNTRPNTVVASKGRRVAHVISQKEKGEIITLVACFNVAGNYLSPCIVIKSKRTVVGLKEKLPAGSDIFLNEQSAYINAQLFFVAIKKFVDFFPHQQGITSYFDFDWA